MRPDPRRILGLEAAQPDEDQTAWLMTFSDLVLQLFAFVLVSVVLASAAQPPGAVAPAPPAPPPVAPAAAAPPPCAAAPREDPQRRERAYPGAPAPSETGKPKASQRAVVEQLAAVGRSLREFVAAEGRQDAVQVSVRDSDLIVTLNDAITFASGSADLLPAGAPIVRRIGVLARSMPDFDLEVDGHTDNLPIHTGFPSNLELSLARAARVVHELADEAPELAERAIAAGFGEHRPVTSNADEPGRSRNRRVEIKLLPHPPTPQE